MDQFLEDVDVTSTQDVQHAVDKLADFVRENDNPGSTESIEDAGLSIPCLSTMLGRLEISKVEELTLLALKVWEYEKEAPWWSRSIKFRLIKSKGIQSFQRILDANLIVLAHIQLSGCSLQRHLKVMWPSRDSADKIASVILICT